MAIQTEGCGIALSQKSPPSVRSLVSLLVGLVDVAWNWQFRFPLEKVFAWIREWGSILNIERGERCYMERRCHYMWDVFTVHYLIQMCHSYGKHGLQFVSAGKIVTHL